MSSQPAWIDIARRKQEAQKLLIPKEWTIDAEKWANQTSVTVEQVLSAETKTILSEKELQITGENDAVDIVSKIREGKLSAEEVTVAFCKRAAVAHQLTNCLTEIFFEEAIQRAKHLDQERMVHPETPLGPLHGLPVSLKDTYHVPGTDATIGLATFAFDPSTSYTPLAEILVSLGAVLYCKTNVPQTLMTADSQNNLFGRTTNPKNRGLTAGGSTGGEGALIALRGSVLGFGTDIAGSVRIPGLCNGIYGFKPSSCMLPFSGQRMPFTPGGGGIGITPSAGPMATSARACTFAMEILMRAVPANVDPSCLRIPWINDLDRRIEDPKKLRIGVITDDGLFTPTPPIRRGLSESVEKLKKAGVTLVPITLPSLTDALPVIEGMLSTDSSKYLMDLINSTGEPLIPSVTKLNLLKPPGPPMPMPDYYALNLRRQNIAKIYSSLWSTNDLDAFLMPPAPHTAVPLDEWATASYTVIWNLLDYPSFLLPVGQVCAADLPDGIENAKYGEGDQKVYKLYTDPDDYVNAPIAVQIIGQKQNDQALAVIAGVMDSILSSK